ncbi:hypothetical protein PCANC_25800 [Puccinia coronata f. sp. avenae]|uniref:Uncharacterized protein n=1 Tax=Puccinia coronata f. sp. avenae TaxID=200324 RepID=A0A2N5S1C9_9BASI|nr:hypothetical protein PCANC_25800 [Puccinia coronata f. sp. avenae]
MAGHEMLKQPCSTSDLGQAPSNQSACWPFKRVCPIMLSCWSSAGGCRVCGARFLAAPLRWPGVLRRPTKKTQCGTPELRETPQQTETYLLGLKLSKLPGNPRTQLHSTYALAYFDHPPVPSRRHQLPEI